MKHAKEYIDAYYPGRHTLIIGDSTVTVPNYKTENFDVIFIDGGHDYDVANADFKNCIRFANPSTIVVMDDTIYTEDWVHPYTIGPTKVWVDAIHNNKVLDLGKKEYGTGKGMSWGKYIFI